MNLVKSSNLFFKELVFGSHLSSIGAGSGILLSVLLVLGQEINGLLLISVYLALQVIYNYDHFSDLQNEDDTNGERNNYLKRKRDPLFLLIFYIVLLAFISLTVSFNTFLFFILFVFGGALYTEKFKRVTKRIPFFKNFYVSLFFAILPLSIIFSYERIEIIPLILILLFVFTRVLLNTIYFDIKDVASDKKMGLKTVPVIYGHKRTINILHLLNVISSLIIFFGVFSNELPVYSLPLSLLFLYSFYYLKKSKKEDGKIKTLSYLVADGEYLLWPMIIIISKFLIQ